METVATMTRRVEGIVRHPERIVLGASLAAIVAAFVASALYVDLRMREDTLQSSHVSTNSLPSSVHLAELRSVIHDLDDVAMEAIEDPVVGLPRLDRTRASLRSTIRRYEEIPSYSSERVLWNHLRTELERTLGLADRLSSDLHAQPVPPADGKPYEAKLNEIRRMAERSDLGLRQLLELNALEGQTVTAQLDADRRRINVVSFALAATSCALSLVLGVVAFRSMRRYTALAERRADELENFANRVAHDIRGPLTPALGAIEIARRELPNAHALAQVLDRGGRSIRLVESIVDGLLGFARAGAKPEPGTFADLPLVAEAVLNECESYATERDVKLSLEPMPPESLACAPGVLASILSNLVRNAIKYMGRAEPPNREVTIRAKVLPSYVRCEVLDTGPGIPETMRQSIFLPQVRLDRGPEGLGLGLATVDRLVRSHGGKLGVVPGPKGTGSLFWFEVPRRLA